MMILLYWIPQFIGGCLGCALVRLFFNSFIKTAKAAGKNIGFVFAPMVKYAVKIVGTTPTPVADGYYTANAFYIELWCTFLFVSVYLIISDRRT